MTLDVGMVAQAFDWSEEINKVVTKSLVTTFGLDFLLLEDKKGGDVDTIHNVRQGIWATEQEMQNYECRGKYDSEAYHRHANYIETNRINKELQKSGELKDAYRNNKTFAFQNKQEKTNLDHVIAAVEIHNDAGRVLAGLDGVELANKSSNLCVTGETINKVKNKHSITELLGDGKPLQQSIASREVNIEKLKNKLESMPQDSPQQKHEYQQALNTLKVQQERLEQLLQVNPDTMKKVDAKARAENEKQINSYYTSSKFFNASINAAGVAGIKMGLRESLGLVFAEIWFELKEQIPNIYAKYKKIEFKILDFLNDLKETIINIVERVKIRFKDLLLNFGTGTISGIFSSITTTILNIFLTTTKIWGKMIRETWLNIVNIAKLVFFNPENLSTGQLAKATFKILSASIGVVAGMIIHENLVVLEALPFLSAEIRGFFTALATGIITLGLSYFIEQSPIMLKFWEYLDGFKTKYERTLDHFKEINTELDRYIFELTQLEFGLDLNELSQFASQLERKSSEFEKNLVLKQEVEKQGIVLPFETGNQDSTTNWLLGLTRE